MYFRSPPLIDLLVVDDAFARLTSVAANGDLHFVVTYSIKQSDAVRLSATIVNVTATTRQVYSKRITTGAQRGRVEPYDVLRNVRTALTDAKATAQQRLRYQVASRRSDVSSYVNNDALPLLRNGVSPRDIAALQTTTLRTVPVAALKQAYDPQPVLQQFYPGIVDLDAAVDASMQDDPRSLAYDSIFRMGQDPASIDGVSSRVSSPERSRSGVNIVAQESLVATAPSHRLLNYHTIGSGVSNASSTHDLIDGDVVQVLVPGTSDTLSIDVDLIISPEQLQLEGKTVSQIYVSFDAVSSVSGQVVSSVTKTLDVAKHVQLLRTPRIAPHVRFASSVVANRANLEVRQLDPTATGVQVFRKVVSVASSNVNDYELIGSYDVAATDQSLLVQVDPAVTAPIIYRVISTGPQSTMSSNFSSVVARPPRYSSRKAATLTAQQIATGVQLEVRNLPTRAISLRILRWNETTHESLPMVVNDAVIYVDDSMRKADIVTTVDSLVDQFSTYRYVARLIYVDGSEQDAGVAVTSFLQPAPGAVDSRIKDLSVSHDVDPNVTFTISTFTINTDIDTVRDLLANQGLETFFSGDIQTQRDQLAQLIANNVQRVDLTTGERDDFGIITDGLFDDNLLRSKQSIAPLQYGHSYRYEVTPLVRAAETLFDSFQKAAVDVTTKKSYTFNPAKYHHPVTLGRGTIVSTLGASQRYAKSPMSYGAIGSVQSIDVSFDDDSVHVTDALARRFDVTTNLVTWRLAGSIHRVDHFLVFKQVHGVRALLGKAHSEFLYGNCQYVHALTSDDTGAFSYLVVPVLGDYSVGTGTYTNIVIVGSQG